MIPVPPFLRTALRVMGQALLLVGLFALLHPLAGAQPLDESGGGNANYSRSMQLAIGLYESGHDMEAMDRFMEILVKGDPAERPVANEYLNLITQRMSMGSEAKLSRPAAPQGAGTVIESAAGRPSVRRSEPAVEDAPRRSAAPSEPEEDRAPRTAPREAGLGSGDRAVMKREIEGKIQNQARTALEKLRRYEDIRIQMATSRAPRAIAIPPDLLFETGIQFKKDAGKILDILGELVFSLGATQVIILPEGATQGNAKILDMRRTMGISSHFFRTGVAPPRVRVNLLSSQIELPREFQEYKGILLVFLYNQPLQLTTDSALDEQGGPPVSLGSWPAAFDPRSGDGAIVEFSVVEPPAGLMSWRFQILGPGEKKGDDLVPLQEVKGGAPVFHQIYWNGRKNYFGNPYPPGQYEAVLSATDLKNHSRKRHLWITLQGQEPVPAAPVSSSTLVAKAPPAELPVMGQETEEEEEAARPIPGRLQGRTIGARKPAKTAKAGKPAKAAKGKKAAARREPSKTAAEPGAQPTAAAAPAAAKPAAQEPAPSRAGVVNFQVLFQKGTATMQQDSDSVLGRIADTMELYPLDKINLVGYAYSGEPDGAALAKARADFVKKRLVEQYKMKPENIQLQNQVVGVESYKVEIYIVRGG
ncbi:MAG: OmpA family protein [Elusimicrobiota bacterium]|jgi:outer membrane protein OmpA-like peptidoglycan-associated protein